MNELLSAESRPSYYGWVVVAMVFLAGMAGFGLVYCFGVFFKPLATEFHWSRAATAGAFSAYAFTHCLFGPAMGRLADRYGPRITAAIAGLCIGLAMFLMSYITAIWQFYLLYAVIFAIGISAIYAPLMATVSQWFVDKRGLAMGVTVMGLGAGSLIFNPLAAWLVSSYGWRMAYIVIGVICWVVFIPVLRFIKQAPKRSMARKVEGKSSQDFTAGEALKTKAFWMFSLAWLFSAIGFWAVIVNLVPLITDMGVPLTTAGTVAGVIGGVSIAARLGAGFVSDKIGRKSALLISFAISLIGVIFLLFCHELWMFFLFAVIFGCGLGAIGPVLPSLPADLFGLRAPATILGFGQLIAGIGIALGPFAGGYIYDVTNSYHYMIWLCIFAFIVGIIFASLLKSPQKGATP